MGAIAELLRAGDATTAIIIGAVVLATLALFLVIVMTASGEQRRTRRRIADVVQGSHSIKAAGGAANLRRAQYDTAMPTVERILKQIMPRPEQLRQKLIRTGLRLTIAHYAAGCVVAGVTVGLIGSFLLARSTPMSILIGIGSGFFLPHLVVNVLAGRRQKVFTDQFPEAIDLIVRGLRSGLPVIESINAVGREMDFL